MVVMNWLEFWFLSFALGFTTLLAISAVYHYFDLGAKGND